MVCYYIHYLGGNRNCYYCDLCGKSWDLGEPQVKNLCRSGDEYQKCSAWRERPKL